MTTYPTTLCFARNTPSQTEFVCMTCAKDEYGDEPHTEDGMMMVNYDTEFPFIRCSECREILKDD